VAEDGLTTAEARVVEALLADPAAVAFGTVAGLARASGTSGATVVRVARRLGYDGFRDLQAAVQAEIGGGLEPAAERIRRTAAGHDDPVGRTLAREVSNVEATLGAIDTATFSAAVRLLADRRRRVLVVAGDAERGIAAVAASQLGDLRDGVVFVEGPPPRVLATVALAGPAAGVLAVAVRRYDAWLLAAVDGCRAAGAAVVAVTDSPLSPLATGAAAAFAVTATGAGPFDSHVGTLALLHAVVAGVADRLKGSATERLDRIESAWRRAGALRDR
jgi:DNA-binding MurR/RpiR family transcriptional regulator